MVTIAEMPKYKAYKDSGFKWIGEIPLDWEISKLGACLSSVSFKNYPGLPLLSITREQGVIERNIEDQESNHNFIPDDLSGYKLIKKGQFGMNKMKAWQGSYGVSKYTGIVSPAYYIFDFAKEINPDFFNWAIRSKLYVSYFGSASDGVRIGQWDLSKTRMKGIPFILPDERQQGLIAKYLDIKTAQIDEAIAIKQQQISLLKERKQIIVQQAVTQGLDPNVPMKDSGVDWIGMIPEHWMIAKAKYYSIVFVPERAKPELNEDKIGVPWITTERLRTNGIMINSSDLHVTPQNAKKAGSRSVGACSVLATCVGTFGIAAINAEECLINQQIQAYTSLRVTPEYLLRLVWISKDYYEINSTMTTISYVNRDVFADLPITIPPQKEQEEISIYIKRKESEIATAIELQINQIQKLKEYKTTLINSAVTGKIKITPEMIGYV